MELSKEFKCHFKVIKLIVKNLDENIENGKEIFEDMIMFLITSYKFTSEYGRLLENKKNEEEK